MLKKPFLYKLIFPLSAICVLVLLYSPEKSTLGKQIRETIGFIKELPYRSKASTESQIHKTVGVVSSTTTSHIKVTIPPMGFFKGKISKMQREILEVTYLMRPGTKVCIQNRFKKKTPHCGEIITMTPFPLVFFFAQFENSENRYKLNEFLNVDIELDSPNLNAN